MWRVENLRADNDAAYPSIAMRISADAVDFYNPVTKTVEAGIIDPASLSSLQCAINSNGLGFRDQAAAYIAGDVPWFYLVYGLGVPIGTINSKTGPAQTNAGGTTGPILPSGYTSYCPCFPVPLVGSATLMPAIPQGGSSQIEIRGNKVEYENPPQINGAGYPTMAFNLSTWVPATAPETYFNTDAEIRSAFAGGVIGGVVLSTPKGNFKNISLYPSGVAKWDAQDVETVVDLSATGQAFTATFMSSAGTIDNAVCIVFVEGYKSAD